MQITVTIGVQFMLKNRETDIPTMLPRSSHDYVMDVTVSPELEQFVPEYAKSTEDASYTPNYDIGANLVKMIRPRVKKAYPELWRKEKGDNGQTVQFKPTDEILLETAISMDIDDKIDEFLEGDKNDVLSKLGIEMPLDNSESYVANVFLTRLGWKTK